MKCSLSFWLHFSTFSNSLTDSLIHLYYSFEVTQMAELRFGMQRIPVRNKNAKKKKIIISNTFSALTVSPKGKVWILRNRYSQTILLIFRFEGCWILSWQYQCFMWQLSEYLPASSPLVLGKGKIWFLFYYYVSRNSEKWSHIFRVTELACCWAQIQTLDV